jgi:perosamine synthetase
VDSTFIPYGRQQIESDDIESVLNTLRSNWLTTGPLVERFETALAQAAGVKHAVVVSNGTAALHAAMHALDIGVDDEVIVPPLTFAATANAVLYQGGTPVFADVEAETLLIDAKSVESHITPRTKAIIAVDYAGQPCDYDALRRLADRYKLHLVTDACHSLGCAWREQPCGSQADLTVFSFHPVKPITTGEGGAIVTNHEALASRMRTFRNHGITTDHGQRAKIGSWHYEMVELGFNYRLTDIQCALGLTQLTKLQRFVESRRQVALRYDTAFAQDPAIRPLAVRSQACHGYHLYVVRVPERDRVFSFLREAGIGANVHYIPVHYHPYYRNHLGTGEGLCPVAEAAYGEILSLPIFPDLAVEDQNRVIDTLREAVGQEKP